MFEHRLKVFLAILLLVTLTLVLRAAQLQVLERTKWEELAAKANTRSAQIETRRGMIRDYKGVVLAMDEPCVDVCVDYRALAPELDKDWVREVAKSRLKDRLGNVYADATLERKNAMIARESDDVRAALSDLLPRLARVCAKKPEELEDVRQGIVEKVRMRRRYLWYYNYAAALDKHVKAAQTRPSSVWQKWLLDDSEDPPELDSFKLNSADETARHVIVRDVDVDVQTELGKHSDRFPGLELRTGNRRIYPLGPAAAHVLGRVTKVSREDRDSDPCRFDLLRQYQQNDLKGRGGLEELCEPVLRGVRGDVAVVDGHEVSRRPPEPGQDVYASIDVELQQQVEALFNDVPIAIPGTRPTEYDRVAMHGAAVVIDVASAEVRVLASAPGFDPNSYEEQYAWLSNPDNLDMPLLNRATQAQREPGSTIKPVVGMAGVTEHVRGPEEGYECIGYMVVDGHASARGRCWVASMFHKELCRPDCTRIPCPTVAHHPIGNNHPHPTGFLTLADALERSCNPYFESIAHALGYVKLTDWYHRFGLGIPTYVGIAEVPGRVPTDKRFRRLMSGPDAKFSTWAAGIGQGPVAVTPIQMANVAATVARGGVWVRPKLLRQNYGVGAQGKLPPTTQLADRVDLGVAPEALRAVRKGMFNVVNGPAGSGDAARRKDVMVAGKTGTAEAAFLKVPARDPETGKVILDEKKQPTKVDLPMSTHDAPTKTPWYRATGRQGDSPHHSWFIGFAPAEDPQIAFAVMVEYGGSGGGAAGSVASKIVELCIAHDYLKVPPKGAKDLASASQPAADVELLHAIPAAATLPAAD